MGFTGVGKTTMSHILSGSHLKIGEASETIIDPPIFIQNPSDERKIGKNLIYPETKVPNLFVRVQPNEG